MKRTSQLMVVTLMLMIVSSSVNMLLAQTTGTNVLTPQGSETVRCYSTEYDSIRHEHDPTLQTNEEFEEWMAKLVRDEQTKPKPKLIINGVYQIPVIVHVVHTGEAVGTGTNLSAAVIQSQIDVLNEDFRRIFGTNGYNNHPDGADTQIEFCLAKRRPNGTAFPAGEDGINRINRNAQGWGAPPYTTGFIDGTIKPYTIATQGYDAAVYMNFWSVNISGGILGYAQFPTTSLGGLDCNPQSVNTDGVVMGYTTIGTAAATGNPGPYNEGRTATHEIGHWLGLRHIWGDGGCGVDDFCADTPESDASNFGCPNGHSSCGSTDMIENYMDYTDDLCMNIFTNDQKTRMRLVLENSPIRASLITSDACIPPAVSDASIINILNPTGDNCPDPITPTVTLRNRGSSNLTSAVISYSIDGGAPTTFNWTGNIAPASEGNVNLPAFTVPLGVRTIKAYSTLPNGVVDPDALYDTTTLEFAVSNGYQPNYSQDFEASTFVPDVRWSVGNPNGDCYSWIGQSCVSSTGAATNSAGMMTNFGNSTGGEEYLNTPIFILPCNASSANLTFDKAYRRRAAASNDRLRVEISEDCGVTWNAVTLYDQSGTGLESVGTTSNSYWIPTAAGNWDNVVLDLMPYVTGTSKNVRFRFRGTNAGASGGNIYVDNVSFNAVTPGEIQVEVTGAEVLDDGQYIFPNTAAGNTTTATFTITNTGTTDLTLTNPITVTGTGFSLNTGFGTTTVAAGGTTTFTVDWTATAAGLVPAGNVSFGTNDCDEGTFNFQLNGTTSTTPLVADFTGAPTTICQGSTVTYTDASTGATGWTWTFPGGTPASATGVGPHTITYNTAGTYNATLDIVDGMGTDSKTETAYITVLGGVGTALPISEGFEGGVFPPAGWNTDQPVTVMAGNTNEWAQSTTVGTPGNSAHFDNFNNGNSEGNVDDLIMLPADFTGLTSAQMSFDVAYARYDNSTDDQLQVLVSVDCGQTYTAVFDKAGTVLATDANQTTAYTPGNWRNEVIDLTPYIGNGKVDIIFRNTSDWGNHLYIDNVNLTGVSSAATADFTIAPSPACVDQTVTFTDASTGATSWDWNFGAGAVPATATGAGPHTVTFTSAGTQNVSLSVNGGTDVSNQTVTVNALDDPNFNYLEAAYCANDTDPIPTIVGLAGGTFSSTAGITLNSSTGEIDLDASTPGAYLITYTTSGACPNSSGEDISINVAPTAPTVSTSGATTFCDGGSVTLTSSEASGNVWSTAETTQAITVSASGNYTVEYTDGNGCSATSAPTAVTVNALPTAPTVSASGATTFCDGGSVTLTSSEASGNVWSTAETTQAITVSASGNYTVEYTDGNGCSATSAPTAVTVNALPTVPTVSASGATTFCDGGSVTLTSSEASGNVWSTAETTQAITVSTSGNYTVEYTDGNGCSATSAPTAVTVNALPTAPTVSASGATTFCDGGSVTLTSSEASGNVWSTAETTQAITVSTSGNYTVEYTDGNGCSATSAPTAVTVNALPTAPTVSASGATTFCDGSSVTLTSSEASGNVWSTAETTQAITVSASGNYTVEYTDGNGCSATSSATAVTVNALPTAPTVSASGATTFCDGGSVTLTSSEASGNVWSTAETTQAITVSVSGNYTVEYTDGNGCSATSSATAVTVNALPTAPTVSVSGATTFCDGGSVTLTSSEVSGNVWSTAETTQAITVSTSGNYTVEYTDGNGCSVTSAPTTVTVENSPVISASLTNPSTCSTATGSIDVTGTGTGVVTWSGAASGNSGTVTLPYSITGLAAGSYTVDFVTSSGCTSNTLNESLSDPSAPAAPTISASGATTFCDGGSVTLTSSEASGNVWSTTETTQVITVTTSGSYSVTFTDGSGCSAVSIPVVVTVNALPTAPTVSASGATTFCDGGSVTLTSSEASGNVWSTTETTQAITVSAGGNYAVQYTDANGCTATSASTTVTVNALPTAPTVSASGVTTFCDGGSVTLTSSEASGNVWSTTETTQAITVSAGGNYAVQYTDANGCTATSASTTVTVNALPTAPTISASGVTTFCDGGSVTLTSSEASGNVWSTTETTQAITVSAGGNYAVQYTDANGCTATSASTTVTVNALPTAPTVSASGATTFCDGGSVTLTSSEASGNVWSTTETTQAITVSAGGNYAVQFTDANGCTATSASTTVTVNALPTAPTVSASGATSFCDGGSVTLTSSEASGNVWSTTETTQAITVSAGGNYAVQFTDANGCTATSASTAVTVNALPTAPTISASGATTFCDGGSVTLTSSEASGNVWSTTETTQAITVSAGGNYAVQYTDANGCTATSASTAVTVNALPTAPTVSASGATTFCDGGSVTLTSSEASGNVWSTTETTQAITVSAGGNYAVQFTDANGCTATSASTAVTVNALPAAPSISASGATTFCDGGSVDLTSSELTGIVWSTTETASTITVSSSGDYSVEYTDANGCSATSVSTTVVVNDLPIVSVAASETTTCDDGGNITLTGTPAGGMYLGTGVSGDQFDPSSAGVGTHVLTYEYTDANGCNGSSTVTIEVEDCSNVEEGVFATMQVYPNPTTNNLTVTLEGEFSIDVTDARGRIVKQVNGKDQLLINSENFETGVYFLNINTENGSTTVRVVKQ